MHPIATMCRVLGVSPGGYYARLKRPPSARAQADGELSARIAAIYRRSQATYGVPRVHAELKAQGRHVGHKRVARLMSTAGLYGASRRRWVTTTVRDRAAKPASDLIQRNFTATAPNRLWVADISYIPTWAGFLYLAVVLDAFSRKIVGWAMETHLRTELVLAALNMALGQKWPRNFERCDKWKLRAKWLAEEGWARRSFRWSRNQGGGRAARTRRSSRRG
jgi:putative transposase